MKNRFLSFLLIILFVLFPLVSFAHPGHTDSKGGHTDRSTGEYHYHHGYPAHQHINGVCPYDLDDRTGENSGTTGGTAGGTTGSTSKRTTSTTTPKAVKSTAAASFPILPVLGVAAVVWISLLVYWNQKEKKKQLLLEQERQKEHEQKHRQLVSFYQSHTLREVCNIPDDTVIGDDGMPKIIGAPDWGEFYTRYVASRNGQSFHRPSCSSVRHGYPIHVFDSQIPLAPCSRCKPDPLPDRSWYSLYLHHLSVCERENIQPVLGDPPQPKVSLLAAPEDGIDPNDVIRQRLKDYWRSQGVEYPPSKPASSYDDLAAQYRREHLTCALGYINRNAKNASAYLPVFDHIWGDMLRQYGDQQMLSTLSEEQRQLIHFPLLGDQVWLSHPNAHTYHSSDCCYMLLKSTPVSISLHDIPPSSKPCSKCVKER